MPRNFINWSCKLTLCQRERDGGGGQPPVKSEVRAQGNKVGRLWFWGVDAREYPGGLLRLDPAFAYAKPPSSWPLSRVECPSPAPSRLPFPSPMHESEKWKWSHSVVSNSSWPRELQPTRLLHPWDFPGKSTGVGCHCLLQSVDLVQVYSTEVLETPYQFIQVYFSCVL